MTIPELIVDIKQVSPLILWIGFCTTLIGWLYSKNDERDIRKTI